MTPAASSDTVVAVRRLHRLGIRHHGPGSARSVAAALDELRPARVLVELPADAAPALVWVGHPDLRPPVALLGTAVADPERAAFAPLAAFSPEWEAIAWAHRHDVPVAPIDLPFAQLLAGGDDPAGLFDGAGPADPLAALAAAAGEPDAERWWDDLVELRGDGPPVFDAVAEAMAAVRAGTVPSGREARREAHMRRAIRAALADTDGAVVVVGGAWHVPALDPAGTTASADAATLRGTAKVRVSVTWVPWTSRRLGRRTGYGAGVDSPGWYRHVHRHPGPDGVTRFFVDAAHALRAAGLAASPDHVIGASRLADSLAALRDRPRAGLAEVLDAADAVMGGLGIVREQLVVGNEVGEVPADAPQAPLARDLTAAARSARLRFEDHPRPIELDLRTPNARRRSHLLHRLGILGVDWGVVVEGRGTSGTFRETWELTWQPELSVRLAERAGYGTTVESAATAMAAEQAASADQLAVAAALVERVLLADLAGAVGPVIEAVDRVAAHSPDVAETLDALGPLAAASRYGDVRGTDAAALGRVLDALVVRVLAGLERAVSGLDEEQARAMTERMTAFQAALATVDHPARRQAWPAVLARLAEDRRGVGLVQGRATRLLHDAGVWAPHVVQARWSRALTPGTPTAVGAAFVEGFLAGSGTVLLHDDQLRGVLDGWVAGLTSAAFDDVVVLLRRTFGAFEPAERRQLGRLLATGTFERGAPAGDDIDPERAERALATVRLLLGLT